MSKFGFLLNQREDNYTVPPAERLKNWDEFHKPLDHEKRVEQAGRCMHCGVPYCQSAIELKGMVTGCPLHNLIPEWNEEIAAGNDEYALRRLLKTNPFPEFTSRVCPALCEKACLNGIDACATAIHDNENYIIENGFAKGWMQPVIPDRRSGKKVAVIGAGPAGLAAAHMLNQRGHQVTVFERSPYPGGLLMFGIPNMKLDKSVIRRRVELMEAEGVEFRCGVEAGKDISKEDLKKDFDAVILAAGAKKARDLKLENRPESGICFAVDYLSQATEALITGSKPKINARNKHVVIVGGGDTGNDCVATALRQHAKSVVQLEMTPRPPEERRPDNPWPEWPKVIKYDYGQLEAKEVFGKDPRLFSTTVTGCQEKNGRLTAIETVSLNEKFQPVEGSEKTMKCDLLIIAAGFLGMEDELAAHFGLQLTARGTAAVREHSYQTKEDGLFACGDCKRGQSLVVWAIAQGKECAKECDRYLMGYSNIEA
ncbi:MAG: glutamate synthase subunit beta [Erysipelotrichaceae bacterium]|nr:glutamate synthase subunit beta [Erysipelotrichaceae bacterium]